MFESISVSERTRKPWTVAISCAGQCAMIGLLVLLPLITNQALPHGRIAGFLLPQPPAAAPAYRAQAPHLRVKPIPFQLDKSGLVAPREVPRQLVLIDDPDFAPPAGAESGGVPYRMECVRTGKRPDRLDSPRHATTRTASAASTESFFPCPTAPHQRGQPAADR